MHDPDAVVGEGRSFGDVVAERFGRRVLIKGLPTAMAARRSRCCARDRLPRRPPPRRSASPRCHMAWTRRTMLRPVAYFHMPVAERRSDDAFFAPLGALRLPGGTELYLGLGHAADGTAGARRRMAPRASSSRSSVSRRRAGCRGARRPMWFWSCCACTPSWRRWADPICACAARPGVGRVWVRAGRQWHRRCGATKRAARRAGRSAAARRRSRPH